MAEDQQSQGLAVAERAELTRQEFELKRGSSVFISWKDGSPEAIRIDLAKGNCQLELLSKAQLQQALRAAKMNFDLQHILKEPFYLIDQQRVKDSDGQEGYFPIPLNEEVMIGRDNTSANNVLHFDQSVSREHISVKIPATDDQVRGCYITDLNSTNGTKVIIEKGRKP